MRREPKNAELRKEIHAAGVRFYDVSCYLGYAGAWLYNKLQCNLSQEDIERIRQAVSDLSDSSKVQ